jgi:putative transcriptional regulator
LHLHPNDFFMNIQAGFLLHSTPALSDTLFAGTTIYIAEYNRDGATGFIINQPFGRSLNELEEFKHNLPFPLFKGGPVAGEHLFFVHRRPDIITGGKPAGKDIFVGGDFSQAVAGINNGKLKEGDIKIFVGYCGWDTGDLEAEIAEGSWHVVTGNDTLVFETGTT